MPKPNSKNSLLEACKTNFEILQKLVEDNSEIDLQFPPDAMNRNLRDIIAHLHAWHLMMIGWYKIGMQGKKPNMPAEGYTWKTLPALNLKIWKDSQELELEEVLQLCEKSYQSIIDIINNHSDLELFEKKKYAWTGSTSLGVYLISNSSGHYAWAIKLIRKALK